MSHAFPLELVRRARVAWLIFFGGFGLETGVDYLWRSHDGDIHTGGFPRAVWFGLHWLFALASISFAVFIPQPSVRVRIRVLFWCLQVAAAALVYLVLCTLYGIGTRIDHY